VASLTRCPKPHEAVLIRPVTKEVVDRHGFRFGPRSAAALVVLQICSLQLGATVAKVLFGMADPLLVAALRLLFAAILINIVVRPPLASLSAHQWCWIVTWGATFAAMNVAYFQALFYMPIGIAATFELLGPLALATAVARSVAGTVAGTLAAAGVVLLVGGIQSLPLMGIAFGAAAAVMRALYTVLNRKVGQLVSDWSGLSVALAVGALLTCPIVGMHYQAIVHAPRVMVLGLAVAVLSSLIPYALDYVALRVMSIATFGVLLSLSPGLGALIGWVVLGERLSGLQWGSILLIVLSSVVAVLAAESQSRRSAPSKDAR